MERFIVSQSDFETLQVIDEFEQREFCVSSNYEGWEDAQARAHVIADALDKAQREKT